VASSRLNDQESAAMPILPGLGAQPSVTTVPYVQPPVPRVAAVEPARRVTAAKGTTQSDIDPDDKRRHQHNDHSGDRGSTLDVEV
jgi:hypothetical protein